MSYTLEASLEMHAHWASSAKWGPDSATNVYYLDHSPELAARYHVDAHVKKMITETARLLSTAWYVSSPQHITGGVDLPDAHGPVPEGELPAWHARLGTLRVHRPAHERHACALWARASTANYDWLWRLGMALLAEYAHRNGHQHAARPTMWALECPPPALPVDVPQSEPPLVMPDALRMVDADGYWCAVRSYRNYYVQAKQPLLRWKVRGMPNWIKEVENGALVLVEQ